MPAATSKTAIASLTLSSMNTISQRLLRVLICWQGQRASNPQPSVLETDALPIELCPCLLFLLDDLRHDAGADGLAALADGEAQSLLHRDRRDQRHHHL